MDSYKGYLDRKEQGKLTLSERFDNWIRGCNNPPSNAADIAYLDLLDQKVDGTRELSFLERVAAWSDRFYGYNPSSASEEYYAAIAEDKASTGRGKFYHSFRNVVEVIGWVPDKASTFLNSMNGWAYDRLLDLKFELRGDK